MKLMLTNLKQMWEKKDEKSGCKNCPSFFERFSKGQFHFSIWYFILIFLGLSMLNQFITNISTTEELIEYSVFKQKVEAGEIKRIEMAENFYLGYTVGRAQLNAADYAASRFKIYKTVPLSDPTFVPLLDEKGIEYYTKPVRNNFLLDAFFTWVLPFIIFAFIWRIFFKRMGDLNAANVLSFNQNRSQIVAEGAVDVSFKDVAGADEAKQELVEVVDFLKNPEKYAEIGGKIPKGVLLVGPPGCGKTLLARAVAGEAGVTFFRMSGADFVEMFVGVGAARVRDLFKQARAKAPCIIFIDELDAIGKSRASFAGGHDEREQTLNQLLVEMDGFDSRNGVILIGATNRPEILDPALLRPGRFDRQVLVDKPDLKGREDVLKIHSANVRLREDVNLHEVAKGTSGFSGADLANVVNEAALLAVRAGRNKVSQRDFDEAIEKIVAGLEKKNKVINPKEKQVVAYHETGHALTAYFTKNAEPVHKISIIPRGLGALGYTMQVPTEDRYLLTQSELLGKIDVLLGGRAAEELVFGEISTGAANDLTKATDIARKMITEYGMSKKFRNVALPSERSSLFLSQDLKRSAREYSESTQAYIDEEITRMIGERYDYVLKLLKEKEFLLKKIAKKLLADEVLKADEFKALIEQN